MSREFQVTFDCADPAALAAFWAEVLGYELQAPPTGFDSWNDALRAFGVPEDQWNSKSAILPSDGVGPRVFFQRVPEGKTAKNRVHLDIRVAVDLQGDERMAVFEAEAERLEALGATRAYRVDPAPPMELGNISMHDPEGNEFCLD
jgi:hypothetical protein